MWMSTPRALIRNHAEVCASDRERRYSEEDTVSVPKSSQLVKETEETSEEGTPLELSLGGRREVCQVEERRNDIPSSGTGFSKVQQYKINTIGSGNDDVSTHNRRTVVIP